MAIASSRARTRVPEGGLRADRRTRRAPNPAVVAALGLAAAVMYGAFADGGIDVGTRARLEVGVAALSLFALAALLFAPRMRIAAPRAGWGGMALLVLFAAWTGASIAWSIAPDGSWTELNRVLAYALVAAVGLAVGASLPRALERAALAYLAIATAVSLYALGGKAIPGVHVAGIDLNHTAFFSRLRAPLAYWNALALFCVLAVPIAVRAATDPGLGRRARAAATVTLVLLATTIGLTYSRGGVAALAVALVVLLALGPDRLRTAAVTAAGVLGAAPALVVGFTRPDLTHDLVPVAQREGDGLMFGAALIAGAVAAVFLARLIERSAERVAIAPLNRRRSLGIVVAGGAVAAVLLAAGPVGHGFENFKRVKYERQSDPARILQTNSGNRWVWWTEAAGAWADRPLAGWGAGSFPLLHHRYRHISLEVLQPHSVPLQFLAELGLAGAVLGLGALALLAFGGWQRVAAGLRAARAGVPPGGEHRYATALFAGVAAWLVHMWFDWDWDIPGVTLPLLAMLGLLAARPRGMPGRSLAPERSGPLVGGRLAAISLGAALACAIAVSAALPSLAGDHTRDATSAFARGDYAEAIRQADIARRLNPLAVDGLLIEARAAGRRSEFVLASQLLTEAVHRQPGNPQVWFNVARLELAAGDLVKMRQAAQRMLVLDPVGSIGRVFFLWNDLGERSATATGTPLP